MKIDHRVAVRYARAHTHVYTRTRTHTALNPADCALQKRSLRFSRPRRRRKLGGAEAPKPRPARSPSARSLAPGHGCVRPSRRGRRPARVAAMERHSLPRRPTGRARTRKPARAGSEATPQAHHGPPAGDARRRLNCGGRRLATAAAARQRGGGSRGSAARWRCRRKLSRRISLQTLSTDFAENSVSGFRRNLRRRRKLSWWSSRGGVCGRRRQSLSPPPK